MKRKLAIALAMALSLSLACTACSGSGGGSAESQPQGGTTSSTAKSFNLKLAGIKTEDDPATLAMNRFAEVLDSYGPGTAHFMGEAIEAYLETL